MSLILFFTYGISLRNWEEIGLIDREILIQSSIKSSLTALLIRVPVIIANLIGLYNRKCVWSGV